MTLTVNGERREVADGLTVAALVSQLGVRGRVAVELNGEVLRQALAGQGQVPGGFVERGPQLVERGNVAADD